MRIGNVCVENDMKYLYINGYRFWDAKLSIGYDVTEMQK